VCGACSMYGSDKKCIEHLVCKSGGKRLLEIRGYRYVNNIKMDPKDIGCVGVDWIILVKIGFSGSRVTTRPAFHRTVPKT
jgi:hypothetical protein